MAETTEKKTQTKAKSAEDLKPEDLDFTPEAALDAQGNFKTEQPKNTVRYRPTRATIRTIGPDEWGVGVEPKERVEARWDMGNAWTLPIDMFSDRQLQILERDKGFDIRRD